MSDTKNTYASKLLDPRWQKKRLEILSRDNFTCQECGATDRTLHVHHHLYQSNDPWDTDSNLLATLCHVCHEHESDITYKGIEKKFIKELYMGGLFNFQIVYLSFLLNKFSNYKGNKQGLHPLILALSSDEFMECVLDGVKEPEEANNL